MNCTCIESNDSLVATTSIQDCVVHSDRVPTPTCQLCGGAVEDEWNSGTWTCPCGGTVFSKRRLEQWHLERRALEADLISREVD
jgi:hypothetical protein